MYCPMCGAELESENQKFCQNCGSEIVIPSETPIVTDEPEPSPIEDDKPPAKETELEEPITQPEEPKAKTVDYSAESPKEEGEAGEYSKKCLIFAIVSLAFFGVSIGFGVGRFTVLIIRSSSPRPILGIILSSISLGLSIPGLIFASSSRGYSKEANKSEPKNVIEQVGSTLAIFGIIMNVMALALALIGIILAIIVLIDLGTLFPFI
ncbi:MAG: zinc-ribbon domain-containing protein [Promethearchaeati archaeon]